MSISGPNVRDFTDSERRVPVKVEASPLYELLTAFYVVTVETDDDPSHELTPALTEAITDRDPGLVSEIQELTSCELGLAMIGVAQELTRPHTVAALVDKLRAEGAVAFRRLLLTNCGIKPRKGFDPELIESAAAGNADAVKAIIEATDRAKQLEPLLHHEPELMLDRIIELVERFADAVLPMVTARQHLLDREAANARRMAETIRSDELIEKLTQGVTFRMQPDVSEIVLIPSIVLRPWVVITEHGTSRTFVYAVDDSVLEADPDAPPSFLVDTFKALGDENRLRLLGVLAERDMGLKEVAARVDLAKSTAHHHLRILRSAGLVRVIVSDDDKCYSLRRDSVDGSGQLLQDFLNSRADRDGDHDIDTADETDPPTDGKETTS